MILLTPTKRLPRHLKIEATNLKVRKKKKKEDTGKVSQTEAFEG